VSCAFTPNFSSFRPTLNRVYSVSTTRMLNPSRRLSVRSGDVPRDNEHEVCASSVADKRLYAVEYVFITVECCHCADAARSEPVPGSVLAMAVMSFPEAIPGSQRSFCSSVQ